MQLCVWQQWIVAATVSSSHSILPPISLSLCVSFLECPVLFPSLAHSRLWLSYSWQGWLYCLWGRISSLCNVNIGNTTHDVVQISSTADTFSSEWSEQDKIPTFTQDNYSDHNRVSSHMLGDASSMSFQEFAIFKTIQNMFSLTLLQDGGTET